MRFKQTICYYLSLTSHKKIWGCFFIGMIFSLGNLVYQYNQMGQQYDELDLLLYGPYGILNGGINGFISSIYLMIWLFFIHSLDKKTEENFYLLHVKTKLKLSVNKDLIMVLSLILYIIFVFLGFIFAYLIMYALVKGELVEAELTLLNVGKIATIKYLQFLFMGHLFLLLNRVIRNYLVVVLMVMTVFIINLVDSFPAFNLVFIVNRQQIMVQGTFIAWIGLLISLNFLLFAAKYTVTLLRRPNQWSLPLS
ncbi:hypothetical protein B835_1618 [Enterococcus mundtii 3F]|uniref:hypothetical protein n=1 Tax=Enterococcus mundtii TaxID=53346 RepID=UPI00230286C9|nr:hypothetical protein [Enterococcus mundtii]MDA9461710.1 hypothetical protein [Enterococcus mundtii 3F]